MTELRLLVVGLALATAIPAAALSVDGLSPMLALEQVPAQVEVRDATLYIAPAGSQKVRVRPWPRYLPQQFGTQALSARRTLHPAGPIDRITLARPDARSPWLVILSGARNGQMVVGAWVLAHEAGSWRVENGNTSHLLEPSGESARPLRLKVGKAAWCLYLLPAPEALAVGPGVVPEREAEAALVALRTKDCG